MKAAGTTVLSSGKISPVFECENCAYRTIRKIKDCPRCYDLKTFQERMAILAHHQEEAEAGII